MVFQVFFRAKILANLSWLLVLPLVPPLDFASSSSSSSSSLLLLLLFDIELTFPASDWRRRLLALVLATPRPGLTNKEDLEESRDGTGDRGMPLLEPPLDDDGGREEEDFRGLLLLMLLTPTVNLDKAL